jgi:hypothetical protein
MALLKRFLAFFICRQIRGRYTNLNGSAYFAMRIFKRNTWNVSKPSLKSNLLGKVVALLYKVK